MTAIANELHTRIKTNPELLAALTSATGRDAFTQILMEIGHKFDLDVTREDAHAVFLLMVQDDELSESELELVVGGLYLIGQGGNDYLCGGDGDDVLSGRDGDDTIDGGAGNDQLVGETGNNILIGGAGNDTFSFAGEEGYAGNDTIADFRQGEDSIILVGEYAREYQMTYDEETGDTTIVLGKETITVQGVQLTPEDISLSVYDWNNEVILEGREGSDTLLGVNGDDIMDGGAGDDFVNGGAGNDMMEGGAGDDTLVGEDGDDTMSGGEGDDVFVFTPHSGNDTISDFTPGEDRIQFNDLDANGAQLTYDEQSGNTIITYEGGTITVEGVELTADDIYSSFVGGNGNDVVAGDDLNNQLYGQGGNDTISGGAGNDAFMFGADDGNDIITDFNPAEDTLILDGVQTAEDLQVMTFGGRTIVAFGNTVITLENVELTTEQILAMQNQ